MAYRTVARSAGGHPWLFLLYDVDKISSIFWRRKGSVDWLAGSFDSPLVSVTVTRLHPVLPHD